MTVFKSDNIRLETDAASNAITQVLKRGPGAPKGNTNAAKEKPEVEETSETNRPDCSPVTGAQKDIRRLRKDAPEIHARVIAGELSPNAGMVEAGFRKAPTPQQVIRREWAKTRRR